MLFPSIRFRKGPGDLLMSELMTSLGPGCRAPAAARVLGVPLQSMRSLSFVKKTDISLIPVNLTKGLVSFFSFILLLFFLIFSKSLPNANGRSQPRNLEQINENS